MNTQPNQRTRHIWSMRCGQQGKTLLQSLHMEEKLQAFLESKTGISLRGGIPVFLLCLIASRGQLIGGSMPFAPALLSGAMMRGKSVGYAALGCALGTLLAGSPAMLLACLALYLLYTVMRLTKLRPNDLTCVGATGLVSYLMPALFAQSMYDHLMALAGAVTAMVLARMIAVAMRVRFYDRELLKPEEIICLAVLATCVLTGFRQIEVFGVSPVIALLLFLALSAGYLCGAGVGAAVGALSGLMLGVTLPVQPYLLCGLALTGLLCGVFSAMGKWGAAGALPLAVLLSGALDARFLTWARAVETGMALIGFVCVKQQVWERLRVFVDKEEQLKSRSVQTQGGLRGEVKARLQEYATLYGRIALTLTGSGAGGQYTAVSNALHAVANDLSVPVCDQPQLAHDIAQEVDHAHIHLSGIQAQKVGEKCRVCVQLNCKRRDGLCDPRMVQVVSRAVGKPLRIRQTGVCPKEGECSLTLEESYLYEITAGFYSATPEKDDPCGDTLTTVQLPEGQFMMALADGMGHGERAQAESRAAVDLMEDFLLARFEPEAALCGVNDLLLHRENDESFTTMDLMLIDLTTGALRAMKIGAVPSYIRRGRRVISITGDALPMGIVEKVRPSVTQLQLQDGDVLIMLSDGVIDAVEGDEKWLTRELNALDARDPDAAARRLILNARRDGHAEDDMTVGILRLMKKRAN